MYATTQVLQFKDHIKGGKGSEMIFSWSPGILTEVCRLFISTVNFVSDLNLIKSQLNV